MKQILDRVLIWQPADEEKLARIVREIEQRRGDDEITDEEWKIIEQRAVRRDLATDEEVEQMFSRYRRARSSDADAAGSPISANFCIDHCGHCGAAIKVATGGIADIRRTLSIARK